MKESAYPILTIGHSNHQLPDFVDLLQEQKISVLADVRSVPYSRYCPHFNSELLECSLSNLKECRIYYLFFGRELGGRVDDPSCYEDDRVVYSRLAERPEFKEAIRDLKKRAQIEKTVLMCAEEDPLVCHRTILVARELDREGIRVEHIRGNGSVETHDDFNTRLLKETGLYQGVGSQIDMFQLQDQDKEKLLSEAYAKQEAMVAYRK